MNNKMWLAASLIAVLTCLGTPAIAGGGPPDSYVPPSSQDNGWEMPRPSGPIFDRFNYNWSTPEEVISAAREVESQPLEQWLRARGCPESYEGKHGAVISTVQAAGGTAVMGQYRQWQPGSFGVRAVGAPGNCGSGLDTPASGQLVRLTITGQVDVMVAGGEYDAATGSYIAITDENGWAQFALTFSGNPVATPTTARATAELLDGRSNPVASQPYPLLVFTDGQEAELPGWQASGANDFAAFFGFPTIQLWLEEEAKKHECLEGSVNDLCPDIASEGISLDTFCQAEPEICKMLFGGGDTPGGGDPQLPGPLP